MTTSTVCVYKKEKPIVDFYEMDQVAVKNTLLSGNYENLEHIMDVSWCRSRMLFLM